MKSSLSSLCIGVIVTLSLVTSLTQITGLYYTLCALNETHTGIATQGAQKYAPRLPWRSAAQVGYIFNNGDFHITSDEEWEKLQTRVIKLDRAYIVSMQQQLHCLNTLRVAYLSYHEFRPKLDNSFYSQADMCIEQIRQHLMCNSDITLDPTELIRESDGHIVPQTNGTTAVHRCRDWRELELAVQRLE